MRQGYSACKRPLELRCSCGWAGKKDLTNKSVQHNPNLPQFLSKWEWDFNIMAEGMNWDMVLALTYKLLVTSYTHEHIYRILSCSR